MLTKQNKTKSKISEKPHTFIMHSCFDSIRHLHISHNAPYLPSLPPPPQKNCNSIVFNNKGYAKFRRAKNLQYGRCACKWRIQTSSAICEKKYEIAACVINLWVEWKSYQSKNAPTEEIRATLGVDTGLNDSFKSLKLWRLTKYKIPGKHCLKCHEKAVFINRFIYLRLSVIQL